MRLGAGESLHDILSSSRQVAEGVSTAGQIRCSICTVNKALSMLFLLLMVAFFQVKCTELSVSICELVSKHV